MLICNNNSRLAGVGANFKTHIKFNRRCFLYLKRTESRGIRALSRLKTFLNFYQRFLFKTATTTKENMKSTLQNNIMHTSWLSSWSNPQKRSIIGFLSNAKLRSGTSSSLFKIIYTHLKNIEIRLQNRQTKEVNTNYCFRFRPKRCLM